ncbi:sigma-w pathway protein ysdB [Caryophanon tenue]|uniref:Sigma-w pathway protein ysdB n=1 Tax=Caryophanon tenue TaxID=33978 RepID=A0A1C0YMG5_9BACL|nr:sigma-w pathway protein ysdB [Caryophanon tenue]OCS88372.1 sigma-w pathway protein ysdB [Caryophanon tenue]
MIPLLIRLAILVLIVCVIVYGLRFLTNKRRKLEAAQAKHAFYFYDEAKNARQNFFITYKGALFEGEKYLGATANTLDVTTIFIDIVDDFQLQGFTKEDFLFLEQQIQVHYPHATINWKSTIEQLLQRTPTQP